MRPIEQIDETEFDRCNRHQPERPILPDSRAAACIRKSRIHRAERLGECAYRHAEHDDLRRGQGRIVVADSNTFG